MTAAHYGEEGDAGEAVMVKEAGRHVREVGVG